MNRHPSWAQFGETLPHNIITHFEHDKWLIPFLLPKGFIIFGSAPKTGKTWLSEAIALAISDGFPVGRTFSSWVQGLTIHYAEDDPGDLVSRIPVLTHYSPMPIENYYIAENATQFSFEDQEARDKLEALCERAKPVLLVFDTARRFFSGDENSSTDVAVITNYLVGLYRDYGVNVILNHHLTGDDRKLRGSTDFVGAAHYVANIKATKIHGCEIACRITPTHTKAVRALEWSFGITAEQEDQRRYAVVAMDTATKLKYQQKREQLDMEQLAIGDL